MKYYMIISTPYGDRFKVDLMTGYFVSRWTLGGKESKFSNTANWKFKAFTHVKRNDRISLEWIQAHPSVVDIINWTWKNGNPQWTVMDIDHGTTREWGNTKYHGVCSVQVITEED